MEASCKLKENFEEATLVQKVATIIEFVGPPGAGKTTSCSYFSQVLKEKNLQVYQLQDVKDYLSEMGSLRKLSFYGKTVLFKGRKLMLFTIVLAFFGVFSFNAVYRYSRLSVFDLVLKQFVKDRNADVVLLDQWSIQEVWSATIFRLKSYQEIPKRLKQFYFKTDHVIYFDIDVPTAAERISGRPTNRSRFDRMRPDERLEELDKYSTYLFQLFEKSDCENKCIFSARQRPEENAAGFLQFLNASFVQV
ncbi:nucleoside/nucleotide kinase family protein [Botryobacter ruber]|uniref:hypothetical protein n=1 Tax=Botryobacter ruber TaxID=2171629 RepID=UPI000E0C5512|nr:hypothetical protein [Botryobacter ruber]